MQKKALITGVTGQDGAYLSELLLEKGYEVTVSSVVQASSTPSGSTTCIRIRTKKTHGSSFTTVT